MKVLKLDFFYPFSGYCLNIGKWITITLSSTAAYSQTKFSIIFRRKPFGQQWSLKPFLAPGGLCSTRSSSVIRLLVIIGVNETCYSRRRWSSIVMSVRFQSQAFDLWKKKTTNHFSLFSWRTETQLEPEYWMKATDVEKCVCSFCSGVKKMS